MKERIKKFAMDIGVDDVGIVAVEDYKNPRSPDMKSIFPGAKSLVVLAYKELSNCESENMQIATGGRLDVMEFTRPTNYRVARFLEKEFKAKAMTVPPSYPLKV
jgi:epoxyqueuosine reductase